MQKAHQKLFIKILHDITTAEYWNPPPQYSYISKFCCCFEMHRCDVFVCKTLKEESFGCISCKTHVKNHVKTHGHCNNLPHDGELTKNTCTLKTRVHEALLISSKYTHDTLHLITHPFPIVARTIWAQSEIFNNKKFARRGKITFYCHHFFLMWYMISKFRMQSLLRLFIMRHNSELPLSCSFWENATLTCPCNN